ALRERRACAGGWIDLVSGDWRGIWLAPRGAAAAGTAPTAAVGGWAGTLSPTAQPRGRHSVDRHRDFRHPDRTAAAVCQQYRDHTDGMVRLLGDRRGVDRGGECLQLPDGAGVAVTNNVGRGVMVGIPLIS